ncbi:methyltransferase domain-containing protein [uncultured Arcticibacterium sp.]|uniref:class I SAM-dependent methyltransferase n=1 Tax=uncultured Arcticibacterium sp. TaxID=2173042 RepID=UPI0030F5374D
MSIIKKSKPTEQSNGVYQLSAYSPHESFYLKLRTKEGRVLSDDLVKKLPDLPKNNPLFSEWQLRKDTQKRFCGYLKKKRRPLKILELGCGNGWFSSKMAEIKGVEVLGLDLNLLELEQAQRLFGNERVEFAYGNIFENIFEKESFDMVVINAAIQYFPSVSELFTVFFEIMKSHGEIHVLDSPFYKEEQISEAKERSLEYYKSQDCTEMANFYFHHGFQDLKPFSPTYRRTKFYFLKKVLRKKQNPFVWAIFRKK